MAPAEVMDWPPARGADAVRTALEDNIRISRDRLAKSNAELVEVAVAQIGKHDRRVATAQEASMILGFRARIDAVPTTLVQGFKDRLEG